MKRLIVVIFALSFAFPWTATADPARASTPEPEVSTAELQAPAASAISSLETILTPGPQPTSCEFTCITGGTCPRFEGLPKPRCISGCCVY